MALVGVYMYLRKKPTNAFGQYINTNTFGSAVPFVNETASSIYQNSAPEQNSDAAIRIRPPAQAFAVASPPVGKISFLHPAYADGQNLLLILPALDNDGIHHETARIACCIIANCRWDGYFSISRNGPRIDQGPDDVLAERQYFFHVDGDNDRDSSDPHPYPIVPSFDHLRFPPQLPPSWAEPAAAIAPGISDRVLDRDRTCRVTSFSVSTEIGHVVPAAQEAWWRANAMFQYTARPERSVDTYCADNALLLRRDVHQLWDTHRLAFLPKRGRWVVHVLSCAPTTELQDCFHNLELQPLTGVRPEFLLAEKTLLVKQRVDRTLVMLGEDRVPETKRLSGAECFALFGKPAQSRSQSPKKRSRSATAGGQPHGDDQERDVSDTERAWLREQWGDYDDAYDSHSGWLDDISQDQRGRPTKRHRPSGPLLASCSPSSRSVPSPAGTIFSSVESEAASRYRDSHMDKPPSEVQDAKSAALI
ncbi:hypothetical protein GGR57DRAFT_264073 [Xylariaceae sp. FL1272]|nr:hypothetical protein GGR57DRAFT_264073 [Xylariaceae sp. FL1272]